LNDTEDFSTSVTIPTPQGFVVNVPVYVRLNADTQGAHNGVLTISASDVDAITFDLIGEANAPQTALLYYWHFNTLVTPNDVTVIDADFTLLAGFTGSFEYTDPVEGQRDIDAYGPGTLLNIQMGETQGSAARVRNPSADRSLVFDVPTTGAENIIFAYAVQRSNNGSLTNTIAYSLDGLNFIDTDLENNTEDVGEFEVWQVLTYDFSAIEGANDNANFKIRITWNDENASNPSGNNRFDNITVTGNLIQEDLSLVENQVAIAVYPNPAQDEINLISDAAVESYFVINSLGVLVAHQNELNSIATNIDVSNLEAGVYIVLIQTKSGYAQVRFLKK
jgi:hypothetical protein